MFAKSIRFKITILYMAILAVTLTSFSGMLYHNVSTGLHENMDTLLKSSAGGVEQAIDTYWQASNIEAIERGEKPEALRKRRNYNFSKIAHRWVKQESTDPRLLDIIIQIFDTDGNAIASSKNTQNISKIPDSDFISVLQGKPRFDTINSNGAFEAMKLRIFTTPVFEGEKVAYIVQVASPLSSIEVALNKLKVTLFILFPLTVLITGVMGAFLAKATLHPVDSMIHTIHQITAENMKLRLKVPETKDEIQHLAETFNDMLKRLESAFSSQRRLFENLSHELKTPLTILKGEFEVVLRKLRTQEEYKDTLASALEEINRIAKLAENLLLLARFDSKESFPEKRALELNALTQAVINNIKGLAELKNIRMNFKKAGSDMLLTGDESQLKTLILNILDNAVKYTPNNGIINIALYKDDAATAKISIDDNGVGIPGEELAHVFDRFYRADKSRNSTGFGLGLSIAKSIAEAHKGAIDVKSKPSGGTIFTISLPLS